MGWVERWLQAFLITRCTFLGPAVPTSVHLMHNLNMPQLDAAEIAKQWLRALRGRRSQWAASKRLGYRTNIFYRWESGRCFPTAARSFELIERFGGSVEVALSRFYQRRPAWMEEVAPASRAGAARLLEDLRGNTSITALATRTGFSRSALSRWFKGSSEPTLPEYLEVIQACSLRLVDFIVSFTDPRQVPAVHVAWERLTEARELAYRQPWTHAVLRALSLKAYCQSERHSDDWLAQKIGIAPNQVHESLEILARTEQVTWDGTHYREHAPERVDTRVDSERARELKAWWLEPALERLRRAGTGLFAYNLCAISERDLQRIEELQRRYYREMSRLIADSEPAECVVLYCAQLFGLET